MGNGFNASSFWKTSHPPKGIPILWGLLFPSGPEGLTGPVQLHPHVTAKASPLPEGLRLL